MYLPLDIKVRPLPEILEEIWSFLRSAHRGFERTIPSIKKISDPYYSGGATSKIIYINKNDEYLSQICTLVHEAFHARKRNHNRELEKHYTELSDQVEIEEALTELLTEEFLDLYFKKEGLKTLGRETFYRNFIDKIPQNLYPFISSLHYNLFFLKTHKDLADLSELVQENKDGNSVQHQELYAQSTIKESDFISSWKRLCAAR